MPCCRGISLTSCPVVVYSMSLVGEIHVTRMLPDFKVDRVNWEIVPTDQPFIGSDEFSGTLCITPDVSSSDEQNISTERDISRTFQCNN